MTDNYDEPMIDWEQIVDDHVIGLDPTSPNVAIAVLASRLCTRADAVIAQALLDNDDQALTDAVDALTDAKAVLDEALRRGGRDTCLRCGRPFADHVVAFHNPPADATPAEFGFDTSGIYCRPRR